MKNIDPKKAIRLPVHDATILALCIPSLGHGFDEISFRIKINAEECFDSFTKLGFTSRELWLIFKNCTQIGTRLIGYCSGREVISSFRIIESSELKQEMNSFGFIDSSEVHFRIQGSHGSQFDILTNTVSISELAPPTMSTHGAKTNE
jgi:hypothetical protein